MTAARPAENSANIIAAAGILRGQVQGLGVRPAIAKLAATCNLSGSVSNVAEGVAVTIEGRPRDVASFQKHLLDAIPRESVLDECRWSEAPASGRLSFVIVHTNARNDFRTPIPRDRAVCDDCLRDTFDASSRRHRYAFTSCTKCGPRFSIIRSMPYERAETTMREFDLCERCAKEYRDPDDPRFHAQTNACPDCGPKLWCSGQFGHTISQSDAVIAHAAAEIHRGRIIALRGIGGYQLICDATNAAAVQRLRVAKQRPDKPFAVMLSRSHAESIRVSLSTPAWAALRSTANPIVIQGLSGVTLAPEASRGLSSVGVMLPSTPLHVLLSNHCHVPLVVTSGNLDGEPLAVDDDDARTTLSACADWFVHHDRPIAHPVDDSVVRIIAGRPVTIRLARGLAPLPLPIETETPGLALGGHQKVAIACSNGFQAMLGPHLGDLDSLTMRHRFESHLREMLDLYDAQPQFVAIDQHPDYFTSRWADQLAVPTITVDESGPTQERRTQAASRLPPQFDHRWESIRHIVRVQHHHAHIAAGMIEHGWHARECLGIAFDGTGFGTDGTIWGGEFLLCTLRSFRRVGRIRPFALTGGDLAIREPWRIAASLLAEALPHSEYEEACRRWLPAAVPSIAAHASIRRRSPLTSSAGRLFDGVAALTLRIQHATFEAQPAMQFEDCCDPSERGSYDFPIGSGDLLELDWRPAIRSIVRDLDAGVCSQRVATRFHRGLAHGVATIRGRLPNHPAVLSGGVFQNQRLTEEIAGTITDSQLGIPGSIPPNDGGLAAGQLAIATEVISSLPVTENRTGKLH